MSEFKVGDRVYNPFKSNKIEVVKGCGLVDHPIGACGTCFMQDGRHRERDHIPSLIEATLENWELLSKLYPNVVFEKPKAVGSDLTRQLLAEGAKEVLCWVSKRDSDASAKILAHPKAIKVFDADLIIDGDVGWFVCTDGELWRYAVPIPRNHYAMDDSDE